MKNLCFDLRGRMLRVLIADNGSVVFTKSYDQFSLDDAEQAGRVFAEIASESGVKPGRVHVILPTEAAGTEMFRLQNMSPADAEKVIRRKIDQNQQDGKRVVRLMPGGVSGKQVVFYAQTVKQETVEGIINLFRSHRMGVRTVSTALFANCKALARLHADPSAVNALFDIDNDLIEISVLHEGSLVHYEKIGLPPVDVEQELYNGVEMERIQKMRLFRIAEAVYSFHMGYKQRNPDRPIRLLWLCGGAGRIEGIRETLKESTGLNVSVLNTIAGAASGQGFLFSALHGMALGLADRTAVNFVQNDVRRVPPAVVRTALVGGVSAYLVLLLAGYLLVEAKYNRYRDLVGGNRTAAAQQQTGDPYARMGDALRRLLLQEPDYYPLLSYLAGSVPDNVYIESLSLEREADGRPMLDIGFVTDSGLGGGSLLTGVVGMLDGYPGLKRRGEPHISISRSEGRKMVHFKLSCEVLP